jgi:iron complex outermembrane receptor protein
MRKISFRVLILGGVASAAVSSGARAAEAVSPEQKAVAIEEVVVTARRREERLQTVPVAVTAVSGETLARKNVNTVQDLVQVTPSLTTTGVFSNTHVNFSLRGRSAENNTFGNVQPVEVYFADVPQMAAPLAQFYDVESVQVLRGPQGTLFGRASNGGAVLFTPRKPGDALEGFATAQFGNYNDHELEAAVSIPIIADKLAIRLAGNVIRRDGYTKVLNQGNFDLDDRKSDAFRVSATIKPTAWLTDDLVFDYVDVDQHAGSVFLLAARPGKTASNLFNPAFPQFLTFLAQNPDLAALPGVSGGLQSYLATVKALGPRKLYLDTPASTLIFQNTVDVWSNTTRADFGGVTVKNILGYQRERRASGYNADGAPFPILGGYNPGVLPNGLILKRHQWSDEVQVLGSAWNDRFSWLVGGYYQELTDEIPGNTLFGAAFTITGGGATWAPTQFDKTSQALFTQETFKVTDRLSVTGGFRRTWDHNDFRQFSIKTPLSLRGQPTGPAFCVTAATPASFSNPLCLALAQTIKSNGDNWTVGADYRWTDDVFTYASASQGYRAGGINTTSTIPALRPFGTENIRQYEIGLKTQHRFMDVPTRFNVAAYQQELTNAQVGFLVFNPARNSPEGVTLNAPKATVRGVEVEGEVIFSRYLRLSGFYDYTDAKYDQFGLPNLVVDPTVPGGVRIISMTDVSNNPFPNTPKSHLGATAQVTFPISDDLGELNGSLSYYRQARFSFATDSLNEPEAISPGYALWNAQLQWRNAFKRPVDITFFVKNLTDKFFIRGGIGLETQLGITQATPGEPRTYGVQLRYRFGAGS